MDSERFRRQPRAAILAALLVALLTTTPVLAQPAPEQAAMVTNAPVELLGGEPTLRAEDATVTRYEDRVVFDVRMDTPAPGSYVYPKSVSEERRVAPEVFTAWVFVFNHPEHCVGDPEEGWEHCGADDFSDLVRSGVYGVAGHVSSVDHEGGSIILDRGTDGQIVLRGEIGVGDPQRPDLPPDGSTYPLENPLGAEIHVAIAPHGQFDPATYLTELYEPVGDPTCDCWWVSFFGLDGTSS